MSKKVKIEINKTGLIAALLGIALILSAANTYSNFALGQQVGSIQETLNMQYAGSGSEVKDTEPIGQGTALTAPPSPAPTPPAPSGSGEISVDDDASKGSEDAPITIIEFSDYECPFCGRFYDQTLSQIEENYVDTGKVKLVFRDFPLSFHANAQEAAEAAECAGEQGKYWEMHDKLFENQGALGVDSLKQYAKDLGLNSTAFDSCLDSGQMASEVQKDFSAGQSYGVSGTPSFFINGEKLVGAQPYDVFEQVIEAELAKVGE